MGGGYDRVKVAARVWGERRRGWHKERREKKRERERERERGEG
jgi:hypothetical protein